MANKSDLIVVCITYAGILVRVVKYQGVEYVLLKTISDAIGVDWRRQRQKVIDSPWLRRRLGVIEADLLAETENSGGDVPASNPTYGLPIYIRLNRVAAFLGTINPDKVRAAGNLSASECLESKISERDDALHDYEELGVAINLSHAKNQDVTERQFMRVASILKTKAQLKEAKERQLMDAMIAQAAEDLGIAYQPDMLDVLQ